MVLIAVPLQVTRVDQIVAAMRANPIGVRYSELMKVRTHYFGEPRQTRQLTCGVQDTLAR